MLGRVLLSGKTVNVNGDEAADLFVPFSLIDSKGVFYDTLTVSAAAQEEDSLSTYVYEVLTGPTAAESDMSLLSPSREIGAGASQDDLTFELPHVHPFAALRLKTQEGSDAVIKLGAFGLATNRTLGTSTSWDGVYQINWEETSALSTGTSSGFQWSTGNGDMGDGFGHVIPHNYEIVAISISCASNSSATGTIEAWVGSDSDTASSASGISVSLASGERHNFTAASTPYSGNAGDWITLKTTAASGTIGSGLRASIFVRPR